MEKDQTKKTYQDKGEFKIQITVKEPLTDNSQSRAFVTYLVTGIDKNGHFQIRRRYSDFYALRQAMVQYFLGLYIPPISSKKATGNTQQKFVQQRKRFLDYFCIKVSQRPFLFYSQMFQFFIRGEPDFQRGLKSLPLSNLKAQLHLYKQNFTAYIQNTNSAQLLLKNETDYDYLKKAEFKFQNIREEFRAVADAKKNYADQFNYCFQTVFPEYEQKFLLIHAQKNRDKLILKEQQTLVKIKEYRELTAHNPLEDYVEMISYELRQARALIQAVQTRKKAEDKKVKMENKRRDLKEQLQKLEAGKSTFKSFFASGTKEVQIQSLKTQIPQLQEQCECLNQMINLMNGACNNQIKEYKQKRGKQYVNVLRDVAKKQIKELTAYGNILRIPLKAIG